MFEESVRASIEVGEIARVKDYTRGIAISPFDSDCPAIRQHSCSSTPRGISVRAFRSPGAQLRNAETEGFRRFVDYASGSGRSSTRVQVQRMDSAPRVPAHGYRRRAVTERRYIALAGSTRVMICGIIEKR